MLNMATTMGRAVNRSAGVFGRGTWALGLAVMMVAGLQQRGLGHTPPPRNPNLKVENVVRVLKGKIVVEQKQMFEKDFLRTMWDLIDVNKDGGISADEKKSFAEKSRGLYTDYSFLWIDWVAKTPVSVDISLAGFPEKKPKDFNAAPKGTVAFTCTYDYLSPSVDLVELIIPRVDAHEINCRFDIANELRAVRANLGKIRTSQAVEEMQQIDGLPDSFSVILEALK